MPIYSYKCGACGHESDVLQKISDTPLSECPVCGSDSYTKQLTAAGFVLKGGGWYVTDFKNSKSETKAKPNDTESVEKNQNNESGKPKDKNEKSGDKKKEVKSSAPTDSSSGVGRKSESSREKR